MTRLIGGDDVCHCPAMPVLWYRVLGAWSLLSDLRAELGRDLDVDTSGLTYAQVYTAAGAEAWVIACPDCRMVYIGADTAPRTDALDGDELDDPTELVDDDDERIVWVPVVDVDVGDAFL